MNRLVGVTRRVAPKGIYLFSVLFHLPFERPIFHAVHGQVFPVLLLHGFVIGPVAVKDFVLPTR